MTDTIDIIATIRADVERQKESLKRWESGQFRISEVEHATGAAHDLTQEHTQNLKRTISEYERILMQLQFSDAPEP